MKHYKDAYNNLFAYESDGSQDAWIRSDLIAITDEEADQIRQAKIAEQSNAAPKIDSVEKLKSFLAANPDVAKLLGA